MRAAFFLLISIGACHHRAAVERPAAELSDRELCDQLLARKPAEYAVMVDPEPTLRRKVIVSDLHLGPGGADPQFAGIEDFYSDAEWDAFLAKQAETGPTDLIINGDFIEFWQIAAALHVLPKRGKGAAEADLALGGDQDFAARAVELVIAAHPTVFHALGTLIGAGDHRVIIIAGNHDADLLWPKVQRAIARAVAPRDPSRLVFVAAAAYEHGGVHVEHGHAYDAANRFATNHAPFGRASDGKCRLQSSWGEIFVDQFYTETERTIPFIDNLHPESAAILWAMRDNPDPARDMRAALRFIELLRTAEPGSFNRNAAASVLQGVFGTPGKQEHGPESTTDVVDQLTDRLVAGDASAESITRALVGLYYDPSLAGMWHGIGKAASALPDVRGALGALRSIDAGSVSILRERAFGDVMQTAAKKVLDQRPGIRVVVFGHTHDVGGALVPIGRGFYANSGSWISAASVADLRKRGVTWDKLSLADHQMFPSKMTAVIVEYDAGGPKRPGLLNAN